ncbi:MAG: trypsin-like peptidase domain-containing protein [Pseudomonadota bacterium]
MVVLRSVTLALIVVGGVVFHPSAMRVSLADDDAIRNLRDARAQVVSILPIGRRAARTPRTAAGRTEAPEGSGVIVRFADGTVRVVTAAHVVAGARDLRVRTADGSISPAWIVAQDRQTDIALIATQFLERPSGFTLAPAPVEIGDRVCAIGNAFGLDLSVTCGVVSARGRAGVGFNAIEDFVQTDAPVNPGASGGALVTQDGRLVGILSAIFTKQSDANIGVNFAVSTALTRRVVTELHMNGRYARALSGLQLGRAIGRLGTGQMAARVVRVRAGSPGALAGLRPGDAIYGAGGDRVRKPADFRRVMNLTPPPFALPLKVMRGTRKLSPVLQIRATDVAQPRAPEQVGGQVGAQTDSAPADPQARETPPKE